MAAVATIELTSAKAPVLTEGDISPAVMMDFENAVQDFFIAKSVPAEKEVVLIMPGIKDLQIQDWIGAQCDCIVALSFVNFMKELWDNYLPQDWEDQVCNDILTSTLAGSKLWSQQLLKLNCLLHGASSVFDDTALHDCLQAHLNNNLKVHVRHSDMCKDKVLMTWIAAMHTLDEE